MSSITGLISGGGGGGGASHIITDPKRFHKIGANHQYIELKYSTGSVYAASQSTFWTFFNVGGAKTTTAANDTYVTILDVTSSDGGYLYNVISPAVTASNQSTTIRITVDGGTPVELIYQPSFISGTGYKRMLLGSGFFQGDLSYFSTTMTTDYLMQNSEKALGFNWNKNPQTGNVYESSTSATYIRFIADIPYYRTGAFEKLLFESTIKVEAKQSTFSSASESHQTGCTYTLF